MYVQQFRALVLNLILDKISNDRNKLFFRKVSSLFLLFKGKKIHVYKREDPHGISRLVSPGYNNDSDDGRYVGRRG